MRRCVEPPSSAVDELAKVAPLPLDPSRVADVGAVRAALNAVRAHSLALRAFEEARGDSAAMLRYVAVRAARPAHR